MERVEEKPSSKTAPIPLREDIIVQRMLEFGLSQVELAARARVSQSIISNLVGGNYSTDIRVSTFKKVMDVLKLDAGKVLNGTRRLAELSSEELDARLRVLTDRILQEDDLTKRKAVIALLKVSGEVRRTKR